jgi:hypothetical protein
MDNLIEDAITAIEVLPQTTNTVSILSVDRTTFNKNYVDIQISGYTKSVTPYPFQIHSCVFTCRNLPYSPTAWPQTGISGTGTTSAADLRNASVTNPTTGLASPYLWQPTFTLTALKNPHLGEYSSIAINLGTVGVTTGTSMYGIEIGNTTTNNFNLFDAHGIFIYGLNSNMRSVNNVFQNTTGIIFPSPDNNFSRGIRGAAIIHYVTTNFNANLDLIASSVNAGNRFWNCHQSIFAKNSAKFYMENALLRSTQSSTNTTFGPGNTGVYIQTNRFDYYMGDNEFTNINTPVNIAVVAGSYTASATGTTVQNGVYANRIRLYQNVFTAGTSTTNYINNAVTIMAANSTPWFVPSTSVSPFVHSLSVNNNTLTEVFRGIYITGTNGFQTDINANKIILKDDAATQYGIKLTNTNPTATNSAASNIVANNELSFALASSTTNVLGTLIFSSNNMGLYSPSVTCNKMNRAYQAFVFEGPNLHAMWAGNTMTLPIARGLVLDNYGVIGQQGGSSTAYANIWTGGTWNSVNGSNGTYLIGNSNAISSPLYVRNTSTCNPPANGGTVTVFQWYTLGSSIFTISAGGDYGCSGAPNHKVVPQVHEEDYNTAEAYSIAQTALYRFLHVNDSVKSSEPGYGDFYDGLSGSLIDKFMQVEEYLYEGNLSSASSLISGIDPDDADDAVEANYLTYYNLYINYADMVFNATDSISLYDLAVLCPGNNGACIYQARALYNAIYGEIINDLDCEGTSARPGANPAPGSINPLKKEWDVKVFPNPATDQVKIRIPNEHGNITVCIKDLSERTIQIKNLKATGFIAILEIELINGAYLIEITNATNEKVTKKLLIAK